jgi:hypothetical protein
MKEIICTVLSIFLSLSTWVNAWPQPLVISGSSENSLVMPILPKISVSPTSVNFGNLNPGGTSESAVTIQNSGKADLVISSIVISGNNPSDFSQTNHCITISGGSSCAVTVTFGPTSGGKKSGTLSITSNDPKKPTINVKLSGSAKSPVCSYSLSSSSQQCDASGGTWSFDVNTSNGCSWTATTRTSWIAITSGSSGSGNGTVAYTVTPNTSTRQRTGKLTIAKQTFTVTQSGAAPSCTYSISPASQDFNSTGGTGSVGVTAQGGCNWTAASNAGWITITSGGSGSGSGSVGYGVSANTVASQRTGTMTIAGQTFTVTQSGITCTYSISSASKNFDSTGGDGSVGVTAQGGCHWTATSNAGWITVTSAASGSGNGTTTYTVQSNASIDHRSGTMTIAGQTFTVMQSGADSPSLYTLSEYQQALMDSYGAPAYITIGFSSDTPMREETWVYADLQKMYLFWDGVSLGETNITIDPNAYSNPPYLDPSLFTKDTKLSDLVEFLGTDYASVDQSSISSLIGSANFKTYCFRDVGLYVAFLDESLVAVQTIDVAESTTGLSTIKSSSGKEQKAGIGTNGVLSSGKLTFSGLFNIGRLAMLMYGLAGIRLADDPAIGQWEDDGCTNIVLGDPHLESPAAQGCAGLMFQALKNAVAVLKGAASGLNFAGQQAETANTACGKCGNQQASLSESVAFRSAGNLAAAAGDQFPYCPGTAKQCTDYSYSSWSACGADGTETRQVTGKIPSDCNIEPPYPPVTIKECCTYSISPPAASFGPNGGSGSIQVTTQTGCNWTVGSPNVDWITITSGASGSGNGSVGYTVSANPGDADRQGVFNIAGSGNWINTFIVREAFCTYSISPPAASFGPNGGSGSIQVTTQTGCNWTAGSPNVDWITITSGASGSGSGSVGYTVSANPGSADRQGMFNVKGSGNWYNTFIVQEAAASPPPCTSYTSSDSACQQNVWWMGIKGLGTITTTYTGVPAGCVGGITVPQPTTRCCDGFNPC